MNKKIMVISGSPRKNGNTTIVTNWVCLGLKKIGAKIEIIHVTQLENKVNGCMGCRECNNSDEYRCVIDDETSSLIRRILEKDIVLFASPVYFGSFSAQMKQIIDRMYCLKRYMGGSFVINPALRKVSFMLIATAGADENSGLKFLSEHMHSIAAGFGKEIKELLVPLCPPDPKDMVLHSDIREKAILFGEQIAQ